MFLFPLKKITLLSTCFHEKYIRFRSKTYKKGSCEFRGSVPWLCLKMSFCLFGHTRPGTHPLLIRKQKIFGQQKVKSRLSKAVFKSTSDQYYVFALQNAY